MEGWFRQSISENGCHKSNEQFSRDDEIKKEVVVKFYALRSGMEHKSGLQVSSASMNYHGEGESDGEMTLLQRLASKKAMAIQR